MIVELNTNPKYPSATLNAPMHKQITVIETPEDSFSTEVVANALKLASKGQRVLIVQLLKGGIRQGHDRTVNLAQNLDWIRCNLIRQITRPDLNELELHNFHQLWKHVQMVCQSGEYSAIILDDLSLAINLQLITLEAVSSLLASLPEDLQIIITDKTTHPALLKY